MNYQQLLQHRETLQRQARLANVAYACQRLGLFAARAAAARLAGSCTLQPVDVESERYQPVLLAHDASQAVVDEHFLDEDVLELADLLAFAGEKPGPSGYTLDWEDLGARLLPRLRAELAQAGVPGAPAAAPGRVLPRRF